MSTELLDTYPKYESYKDSGVDWLGNVPLDWDVIKLKHLVTIRKRIIGSEGESVLSITQKGIKVKDITSGEGQLSMDYSKYQIVNQGDFAMNHMDLLTGYVDISEFDGVVSPDYRVFTNDSQNVDDSYLLKIFQMGYAQKIFFKYGQGVSMLGRWRLPADNFNEFLVPLPSLEEQEKIISFLNNETAKIDQAINLKQQQIEKLNEYKQITIQNAVTKGLDANAKMKDSGIDWIGEIPEHWEVISLRYIFNFLNKDRVPISADKRGGMQGVYPYYGASGIIDYVNDYIFDEKLILIAEDGANLLSKSTPLAFIAEGKYWVNNHAHILKPKYEGFDFWAKLLSLCDYTVYITGAAQPKLSRGNLGNILLPVPPAEEILTISKKLEKDLPRYFDATKKFEAQIERLKEYKTILINQAVSGKIKVS